MVMYTSKGNAFSFAGGRGGGMSQSSSADLSVSMVPLLWKGTLWSRSRSSQVKTVNGKEWQVSGYLALGVTGVYLSLGAVLTQYKNQLVYKMAWMRKWPLNCPAFLKEALSSQ